MNTKYSLRLIVPTVLFGIVLSVPAFAQNNPAPASAASSNPNAPASMQMREAGQEMEGAGSDTVAAAADAYHGTERAIQDATITAEVKSALERDSQIRGSDIHVDTTAGVVTLMGNVPSPDMAAHAAQLAGQSNGVKSVNNQLVVANSARTSSY
jgi:ABC-type phosphate transport system substrate-binding protein